MMKCCERMMMVMSLVTFFGCFDRVAAAAFGDRLVLQPMLKPLAAALLDLLVQGAILIGFGTHPYMLVGYLGILGILRL